MTTMTNNEAEAYESITENDTIQILQEKVQNSAKLGLELYDRLNESLSQLEATQQALWSAELEVRSLENRNSDLVKEVERLEKENMIIFLENDHSSHKDVIINVQSKKGFSGELDKALHEIEILQDLVQNLQLENIALTRHGCNSKQVKGSKVFKLQDDHQIYILQENNENITPSKNGAQPANHKKIFTPLNHHIQSSNIESVKKRECRTPLIELAPKNDWPKEKKEFQRTICDNEIRIASLEEELLYYRTAKPRTPSPQQPGTPTTTPTRSGSSLAYELSQLLSSAGRGGTGHGERGGSPATNTATKSSMDSREHPHSYSTPYTHTGNNSPSLSPSCNASMTPHSSNGCSNGSSSCVSPALQDWNASPVNLLEHYHQQYHRLFERFRSPPAESFERFRSSSVEEALVVESAVSNIQETSFCNSSSGGNMTKYDRWFNRDDIVFVLATLIFVGIFVMSLFMPLVLVSVFRIILG